MNPVFRFPLRWPIFAVLLLAPLFWVVSRGPHSPPDRSDRACMSDCKCTRTEAEGEGAVSLRPGDGRPVRAPNPWFFVERAYPLGRIPRDLWRTAQEEARTLKGARRARGAWEFRGPTNIPGRITDLAVDPTDAGVVFAGTAEGGLLRTFDYGQSWTPLFDNQPCLSIGAVALDPTNTQVVYVGTGEANPGGGSVAYGGAGIFRSTDRGDSWALLGLEDTGAIGRIRIDPTDPNRIYVAAVGDLWMTGPERGVYRSTDRGMSWQKVLYLSDSTGAVDLILRPDQPRTLLAAMWERIRRPGSYQYGGTTCGVYRTTDGGDSWSPVGGGLPASSANVGRIGLSLCASQPAKMAAIYADRTGYFAGVYKSTNGGDGWTRTSDGALSSVYSSYGWWFGNIRVHPFDPNRIYVLGMSFWRSTNGGSSWSNAGSAMHVDHHAMDFGPWSDPVIFEGNDGGVYQAGSSDTQWSLLPDQPVTQIYRLAVTPEDENVLYAGAQDNGTMRTQSGGIDDWEPVYGGDGFQPLIDPTDRDRIWCQYQYGSLSFSGDGGASWEDAVSGISSSDRHNWNTPHRMDPTNPGLRYLGTQRLYRCTSDTGWTPISPDLTGGGSPGLSLGTLTTIDISPLDGQVIWTGSDDGHVQATTDGGSHWADVSSALPDRWVTSVHGSPDQRETAYVTLSGFRWGSPLPHIFRTTDLGASWTAVSGNLPEAPVNDLLIDPDDSRHLIAATDVGVFETLDEGGDWSLLGDNLPNVVVTQLALQTGSRTLMAATYGRSFFAYRLGSSASVDTGPAPASPWGTVAPPSPNPARQGTRISWHTAAAGQVTVEIFDAAGRRIWRQEISPALAEKDSRSVRQMPVSGGSTEGIWWDRRDLSGKRVACGVYLCRVRCARGEIGRTSVILLP